MHSPSTTAAAAVSFTEAEQLLWDLVALPSPSHQEQFAVRCLVGWMGTHGYREAFVDSVGNAVGIIGNGDRYTPDFQSHFSK